ncbi:MAG: DegV family protein [Saccharospirillum sp.]
MSTTLIVDSACDLPRAFLDKYDVRLMPAIIKYDEAFLHDVRDPNQTIHIYESGVLDKSHNSESAPTPISDIQHLLEALIREGEKDILIQTVNRTRSPTFEHSTDASNRALRKLGGEHKVSIRVQDSRTVFAGQGVLAAHTVALIRKGVSGTALRRKVDRLSSKVHAYQIPADLFYLRERARKKGDNSISWLGALLGRALNVFPLVLALDDKTFPVAKIRGYDQAIERLLNHCSDKIKAGLLSPFVCVSYAGHMDDITGRAAFQALQATARECQTHLIVSPMSLSGGVNLGPRTLSVAFACEPYRWEG